MLIGLGYKMHVGKDTVADILKDRHGYLKLSFAAALKDMAMKIDPVIFSPPAVNVGGGHGRLAHLVATEGWDAAKRYPEVRRFLQALGVSARDTFGEEIWIEKVADRVDSSPSTDFVVTDVRFPNEVAAIRTMGGKVVRVDRPGLGTSQYGTHVSETALDGYGGWDYILSNDGLLTALPGKVEDMLIDLNVARRQDGDLPPDGDA
jgi:hypothetical protein